MNMEAEMLFELSVRLWKTARYYSLKDCDLNTGQPDEKTGVLSGSLVTRSQIYILSHIK